MKRLIYLLILVLVSGIVLNSCQKLAKNAIDCLRVSELTSVAAKPDGARKMKFGVDCYASGSIQSVTWEFGDATTATTNTTLTTHTYTSAGNYTVTAKVTIITADGTTCVPQPTTSFTIY